MLRWIRAVHEIAWSRPIGQRPAVTQDFSGQFHGYFRHSPSVGRVHPLVDCWQGFYFSVLHGDVFTASAEAIGVILDANTPAPSETATTEAPTSAQSGDRVADSPADTPEDRPRWDRQEMVLRWRGEECRRYSREADNQFMVLDAFEGANWTQKLKSPFPGDDGTKLKETIDGMNKRMNDSILRFGMDKSRATWNARS
jgi:hypothetical protein